MVPANPAWVYPAAPALRGYHGTDAAGLLGILTSRTVEAGEWGVLFWHSTLDGNRPGKLEEFWRRVRSQLSRPAYIELLCRADYGRVRYGGHAAEKAECDRRGCCRYINSQGRVLRTMALPQAVTPTALWLPAESVGGLLADMRAGTAFPMA